MELAVSVSGSDLDSGVDPRFGRAQGFLIVDQDTMDFDYIENPNVTAGGGAGIQTGQMIVERGVETVLTGNVGPNAFKVLEAAGIRVITGASGSAREAIEAYKGGKLSEAESATVKEYHGTGGSKPGGGMGRGSRMGRGGGGRR